MLVVDHHVPTPDRDAGSLRMFHLMQAARRVGFEVSFVAHSHISGARRYFAELRRAGVQVPWPERGWSVKRHLWLHGARYDVVILSRAGVASDNIGLVHRLAPKARVVFDTVDLHFVRERREAELAGDAALLARAAEREREEIGLTAAADFTWTVSETERQVLLAECPTAKVHVLSTIHDPEPTATPFGERPDYLFVGGFHHPPNVDAVRSFARDVVPLVRGRLPGARFLVVGSDAPPEILALAGDDIVITGHVSDLRGLFEHARLSVAPLRFGAGVKGKINTSMSFGVPVVASELALEGMHLEPDRDVLVGRDPEAFAEAMTRLYQDEALWQRLREAGLASIRRAFSVEAAEATLRELRRAIGD